MNGENQWEWVFQNDQMCLHVIRLSRGKTVIDTVMSGYQPQIWVSDLFSAQAAHLLLFLTDETVLPTDNSSEQALHWRVVFRT